MSSSASQDHSPQTYEPTTPADLVRGHNLGAMAVPVPSVKSPRTARFAEATAVHSPVKPSESTASPFADPPQQQQQQQQNQHNVADVGFGYVSASNPANYAAESLPPVSPPLRSALKTPGTPGRTLNPLSPTFREEYLLEKQEKLTDKENARDLRIKTRVRVAKVFLRFVNFGCSLIVLSLLATTLTIFETTKSLPPRNSLPAWATGTNPWAQYLLLGLSGFSLLTCLLVFYGYWKGGHRRAEKVAVYYSVFSVCFFVFSLVMWVVAAAIYQNSKASGNGKDLWGWSCKHNLREQFFQNDIDYALLCRLQDWGLVCAIIEVVIEIFVILIYVVVFYRFYSKRRLTKSMYRRDKARSDLYLAQLRLQSAPNTPGFAMTPKSPAFVTATVAPTYAEEDVYSAAENAHANARFSPTQYASPRSPTRPPAAFHLQAPPTRMQQHQHQHQQTSFFRTAQPTPPVGSSPSPPLTSSSPPPAPAMHPSPPPPEAARSELVNEHMAAAPGERTYDAVAIPGAYAPRVTSPGFPPVS